MDSDLDGRLSNDEMTNTDSKIFMLLDSDDDGFVTKGELQHMMNVLQAKHDSLVENHEEPSDYH
jgi:Ca2+-binding EF-hand superfamily protein